MLYYLIVNSVNMGNSKKAAKFPRYDNFKENYGAAIDKFLKEYGDGMNYVDAQRFLVEKGIKVSEVKYIARVLHFRRENLPLKKNNQSSLF